MALPEKSTPWPPIHATIQCALDDWSAWYSGDRDRLAERYLNRPSQYRGVPQNRPSQYRGGITGLLARWFWGQPTPLGEKRANLHMPLAGDIARTSSDLLFSEPPALKVENASTQERLEQLLDTSMRATLLEGGEVASALGGAYLRIVWDDEVSDRPWISVVHADAAAPEFRYGQLVAVTFWTVLAVDGQKVVRHLERHERGAILHGVYEGTCDNLGKPADLKAFPQTENLEPFRDTGLGARRLLTATYAPNVRPARAWRDIPGAAGWGISDYQGCETFLDALDETYTSWMRDVRLAKSRILVPGGYLQSNGPGRGVMWEDREVYAEMNIPPTADQQITLNQFAIRFAEHKATCEELIGKVIRSAGYSSGTFGDDAGGQAVTATEIKARNARSMSTRERKTLWWTDPLADITEALLALEASGLFPGVRGVEVERPDVRFQDSVQDDLRSLAETANLLRQAEAASTETLVALVHPDWEDTEQRAEVERITRESGRDVADPMVVGAEGAADAGVPRDGGGPDQAGS